jgi:hypothetical protein
MLKFLKIASLFFLVMGIITSMSVFAFKIIFDTPVNEKLVILGPDDVEPYSKPIDAGGFNVTNLDIDILNNKSALIADEKLRPLPVQPELLPIDNVVDDNNKFIEEKNTNSSINKKKSKKNLKNNEDKDLFIPVSKPYKKNINGNSNSKLSGQFRVQFGSFRNLNKAEIAIVNMKKIYINLLSNINLEIFSYKNNDDLIYHRVWTFPLKKKIALKLCDQFKLIDIVCILQSK